MKGPWIRSMETALWKNFGLIVAKNNSVGFQSLLNNDNQEEPYQ